MDCNKEEALRAQSLAESKMKKGDFPGAQKLLLKAQSLFSGLESLPKMLAVCDVHSSSQKRINGLENWYGVLQVMHCCDDATIKKQYKKLALLLHPDKNKFAGAETAFLLIGEANKLLSDKEKRLQYDIKRRNCSRDHTNGSSTIGNATFLTSCEHCGYLYKYLRQYMNSHMYCSNCEKSFMAYDTGPTKPSAGQEEVRDQGPCNASVKKNVEPNGSEPAEVDKKGGFEEEIIEKNGGDGDESKDSEVRTHKTEDESMKDGVESSVYQEISPPNDKKAEACEAREEGMCMAGKIYSNHKANGKLMEMDMPDLEFNSFELTASSFAVNQVWSLYNMTDGMPRNYARVDKVFESEFKLWITWIDPLGDDKDNSVSVACGVFQDGESEEVDDILIFSTQMVYFPHDNNKIIIYPRIGETWAIFRDWDITYTQTREYDYVEVLSDFEDEVGLGVAYLGKVEGFVSLFRRDAQHGVLQIQIPPSEMLRFSHKVPSFKMTGEEREGVPPGCFELDTAALPKHMFVKKSRKSVKPVDDSKLRKSPRLLSRNNNQTTPKSSKQKAENKSATGTSKKRGRSDEPLSQYRVARSNGGINSSDPETHELFSCKARLENVFNFESQRSQEKFQMDQIWAVYSNEKGMPRKYAQIKRIDTSPEFKLHVALARPLNPMTCTVCCGRFKLKTGIAEVLVPSSFSHQVKAMKINLNRFDIYPRKGEVWALYKNWNATCCIETEEVEIVEVVETNEQSIQAVTLTAKGFSKTLYARSQESNVSFLDIAKTEVSRFSHQIPAFRHSRIATRSGDRECWELDMKAVSDL